MSNIIDMNDHIDEFESGVIACTYRIHLPRGHEAELTGEERFTTVCPECGEPVLLEFVEFINVMHDGDLYGTMVFCRSCSEKRTRKHVRSARAKPVNTTDRSDC